MNDNIKIILHETMEQQTISKIKTIIIIYQLNAQNAILGSGKTIHSKYSPKLYSKYIILHPLLLI